MGHGAVWAIRAMAGGEPQPDIWWNNISAAPISAAPSLAATASCRWCRARCNAACWAPPWRPGTSRAVDAVGELVCTQPIPPCPCTCGAMRTAAATSPATSTCTPLPRAPARWWRRPARHGRRLAPRRLAAHRRPRRLHHLWPFDATINRHGLRMGTSEIYSAVEALPEVLDSLVVDLEYLGRESYMPLFVVLREGCTLDDALRARIHAAIRTALSPRFVPDDIFAVAEVPRTLSGKKQELPIKKLPAGPAHREGGQPRRHGQPRLPGLVRWTLLRGGRRRREPVPRTNPMPALVRWPGGAPTGDGLRAPYPNQPEEEKR